MRRRISRAFRRCIEQVESSRGRSATVVERLEGRCLLSLSAHVLVGPLEVAGNTWHYEIDSPSQGTLGFETLTSDGITTFNGQPALKLEFTIVSATSGQTGTQTNFYAYEPQAFVLLDSKLTSSVGVIDESTSSPPQWVIPESMTANVTVTSPPSTRTITTTPPVGSPSTTIETVTTTTTLITDTPSVMVQVPAGTFASYQVNGFNTTTTSGNTDIGGTTETFVDPTVGVIETLQTSSGNTSKLTNFTGTTFELSLSQPPTDTQLGNTINPVQISVQNSSDAIDTNPADAVTIAASIDPSSTGAGTLSGTTSVATTNGVANFSDLSITAPGTYVLDFKDTAGRTVSTGSFQVIGIGGTLRFKKQIQNRTAGSALKPAVEVELVDSQNKIITDSPSLVTLSINGPNSSNPITGNTAQLVNGVAVFSEVRLSVPGDYRLDATDSQGDAMAQSNAFEITGVPTHAHAGVHLAFHKQHHKAGVNARLRYDVRLEDSKDRVIKNSPIELGLTLNPIDGGAGAVISNSADNTDLGIANNSGADPASINSPGTYTITFSVISGANAFGNTIAPITSDPIEVMANHLAFIKQPHAKGVGVPLRYKLAMEDYRRHIVADSADQLTFSLFYDGTNATLSSGVDQLISGIANNANNLLSIDTTGIYRLVVVDVPTNPGDVVADGVTSKLFEIGTKLIH